MKPNPKTGGEFDCWACYNYITMEHGGIVCATCEAVFCCDENCVKDTTIDVGASQHIKECYLCPQASVGKSYGQYIHETILKFRKLMNDKVSPNTLDMGQRKIEVVLRKVLYEVLYEATGAAQEQLIKRMKVGLYQVAEDGQLIHSADLSRDADGNIFEELMGIYKDINMTVDDDTREFVKKLLEG